MIALSIFYERFADLCVKKDVSQSRAAMDVGLSNAAASGWAGGNKPRETTLRKLAAYFDVPLEYLKCEDEQKENPTTQIGSEVDETTRELMKIWNAIPHEEQRRYLSVLKLMIKNKE